MPIARAHTKGMTGLALKATIPATEAQYAMMFRKGNDELRQAIDAALVEAEADGTYAGIYRKWFGEDAP